MKLRNKKTGKIIDSDELLTDKFILDLFSRDFDYFCSKLAKIQEEWEDYEEQKGIQSIYYVNRFGAAKLDGVIVGFDSEEEAKKAVEKLKAWKRLKDNGFMIAGWDYEGFGMKVDAGRISFEINKDCDEDKDLDLLFGGEE